MGGLKRSFVDAAGRIWERANDLCLGIETGAGIDSGQSIAKLNESSKHKDGGRYEAADYRNIRRIIRVLKPDRGDLLYDIGCGKGRVVCVFARRPLARVVGIDLDPELCRSARANADQLRRRRCPIDIRCEDAAVADLGGGTIYFLYNPFGIETMRDVLDRICGTLTDNPRRIRIVYYTSVLEEEYLRLPWLRLSAALLTLTRRRITIWEHDSSGRTDL